MPQQSGPSASVHSSLLDYLSSDDIAQQLLIFHTELLEATDDIELITQVLDPKLFILNSLKKIFSRTFKFAKLLKFSNCSRYLDESSFPVE